jgi:hypothetical protein
MTIAEEDMPIIIVVAAEDDPGATEAEEPISEIAGAIGLGSSEQPQKREEVPKRIKERIIFFMIYKYSLQKGNVLAKTFLLSLESL